MLYKQAYTLDPFFGASIQCGAVDPGYGPASIERNVAPYEILYNVNLALMYGAKFLSLYTFFAQRDTSDVASGLTYHGIIDHYPAGVYSGREIYTNKYYMLRHTLNPRLKGIFGKTLKKLIPTEQHLNIDASSYYNFISHFAGNLECLPSTSDYDLGFFTDSLSRDYFMIISRYYNNDGACPIFINLDEGCLYNNLVLTKFVTDTTYNILRSDPIPVNLTRGDAELYRIYPVVRWGGSLLANDTTNSGETLQSDMTIESGATLTVNGNYYAKANITVKSGGKIIAGTNGKIIFDPYKKLIVDGTTEIKGSSPINKLTLEFVSSETGIDVLPGSNLTLSYCYITGAYYGLVTRTGTPSYLNITYSNFAFGSTGIVLNGNFYGEGSIPSPTSTISGCNFTTWGTGISVSNNSSVVITQNNFTSCGISILNVPAAYIQTNSIYSGSNESYSGIFFNNSGGYIRNNTIKNRVNGIFLANSSPDIGGNLLENNYLHGLYIGSGSFPNMVGLIQTNPPTYYSLAGYNTIKNNCNNTESGYENDGSEVYFSYSDAHLGTERNPGCNQISDDRTFSSTMNTIFLFGGNYGNEPHFLDAIYNYWGTTTPTSSRFGIATNFSPYYTSMCSPGGGGGEEILVLKTSSGEVVDSISSAEGSPENFTTLEASYSEADNYFATGNVTQAKPLYEQIVSSNYTTEEKLPAYNKLYTIANLIGADETYFNNLQSTFNNIANTETDTLLKKIYNQNAIKCDVSKEEYLTAISKFDNIIQQNPNSEEAIYAEIDIITTAINLDTTNSQLGKIAGRKYLVKGTSDYLTKLNNLLQNKFGINSEEKEQIIPKEYSLYQNYPNPFNPNTTIKFDLPNDGLITLEIFDILGRRIATLLEGYRTAGSYEQVFNASSLASGVYVYKLQAGDFTNSKKMLLLK